MAELKNNPLAGAYGGLLHDVGKAIQRAHHKSDLTEDELALTPVRKPGNYHTHIHAGYTSRFIRKHLGFFDEFEYLSSSHHLSDPRQFGQYIVTADHIASAIDRDDEKNDFDGYQSRNQFKTMRMSSIFEEVDFGKDIQNAMIELSSLDKFRSPVEKDSFQEKSPADAVSEYQDLMNQFLHEVDEDKKLLYKRMDRIAFSRMYGLMYKYLTFVPASTYKQNKEYVSLFDHLKLTSAIASCLVQSNGKTDFHMLEFDVSGIQNFIFKVTEGESVKKSIAKSLRGRSFLISLITDCITMSILHAFQLTESNIIFNTGGGALLLLPDCENYETIVKTVTDDLLMALFKMFQADITFVYSSVKCTKEELERFKKEKAIELKIKLDEAKSRKFLPILNTPELNSEFTFTPASESSTCTLCGSMISKSDRCELCDKAIEISDFLTKVPEPVLLFYNDVKQDQFPSTEGVSLQVGTCTAFLTSKKWVEKCLDENLLNLNEISGIESINHSWLGLTRYIATDVPMKINQNSNQKEILPMDEICTLANQEEWGDPKLGILKMDVDNLGSIFAYGMSDWNESSGTSQGKRSLSKYLTLSRMIELFFGKRLPEICKEVSEIINPEIDQVTKNGTMFYINYAGGDDLVILGPAAGIIELANDIHSELSNYAMNKNITISGGIFIQKPKQPIRFGVLEAEKLLSRAKDTPDKNAVALMDTVVPFNKFGSLLDKVYEFRQAITPASSQGNGYLSRTAFYRLMKLIDIDFDQKNEFNRRIPLALYSLSRNAKNEDFRKQLVNLISQIQFSSRQTPQELKSNENSLKELVLTMKLSIMQTRTK